MDNNKRDSIFTKGEGPLFYDEVSRTIRPDPTLDCTADDEHLVRTNKSLRFVHYTSCSGRYEWITDR